MNFFAQEVKLKVHSDPQVPAQVSAAWLGCNTVTELGGLWQGQSKRD